MKITDVVIDNSSLGKRLWLVEVLPAYEYQNGKRTDNITGYRYVIAMPDRSLEKLGVKIEGKQILEAPGGYAEVAFSDLEIFIYWSNGQPQVGAKAKGISLVNIKA